MELAQRLGSIIGSRQRQPSPGQLRRVCMLVHRGYLRQEGVMADRVLVGIQGELTGADVQFNFQPETDPSDYVNGLIAGILRGKEPAGMVMTKALFVVQRIVEASGLYRRPENKEVIPHVFPRLEPEEIGAAIGRLHARQAVQLDSPPDHVTIPVELHPG